MIDTKNNSPEQGYIQHMELNGKKLAAPFIPFEEVMKGGKLVLQMGSKMVDQY